MILYIKDLPYRLAFDIIKFCLENDIDKEHCLEMINSPIDTMHKLDWHITIPDEYATWIILKFGL